MNNVIFDLDGTIIDSSECIFWIYRTLFTELKIEVPTVDVLRTFIGPPVETIIPRYVKTDAQAACDRFRQLYRTVDLAKVNRLYDGITELFEDLTADGKSLYIASTKNDASAKLIADLLNISRYFKGIYGSRYDVGRLSKAKVIDDLCADYGIKKDDCILIGDTHYDAEGAEESGITVGLVTYGFGDKEELSAFHPVFLAVTPKEVGKKIRTM